jgi:hypothetical protein
MSNLPKYIYKRGAEKYVAKAYIGGKVVTIGTYGDVDQAVEARQQFLHSQGLGKKPIVEGFTANSTVDQLSIDELISHAERMYDLNLAKEELHQAARITLPNEPWLWVKTADNHFGSGGTNIRWAFREAELLANTPNTSVSLLGDVNDSFVIKALSHVRHYSSLSIAQEIELLKAYVRILQDQIETWVSGNHDAWMELGQNYWRDFVAHYLPNTLFDENELNFDIAMGDWVTSVQHRHQFPGRSQHNSTYAMEKNGRRSAHIRAQGHFHNLAVCRDFLCDDGRMGKAIQLGSFKRFDKYAEKLGLPKAGPGASVA